MNTIFKKNLGCWLLVAACLMGMVQSFAQNALITSKFGAISSEYRVREIRPTMNDNGRAIADRGWYYYDDGSNVDAIGLTNGGSFYWGVMFPAGSYTGNAVTKVSMYDYTAHTGNIMIYQGGTTAPGTLVYSQAYACTGSANFVEWTLSAPVTVNPNQNLWIVMNNNDGQYVAPVCNDTGSPNGRWISTNGSTWNDLMTVNPDLAYTWMLRAYIETINTVWDFENGMNGWTTIDADGDGYTWVLGSAAGGVYLIEGASLAGTGHNASQDMVCSGSWTNMTNTVLYPDNYLVSPQVTLTAGSTFSFWACAQDSNYPAEHFGVFISNNGTSNWTMVNEWTMTTKSDGMVSVGRNGQMRSQGNWHNYSVDLSAFAGQKYIAIRHFNCSDQFLLDIDDIVLSTSIQSYTITVSASPTNGGAPYIGNTPGTIQATYTSGQSCTVHANSASGYTFNNWTENGIVVSYNANYTFTVSSSRNLVAHFQAQSQNYTITVSASPTNGGSVYVGNNPDQTQGTYTNGQSCTVHATANSGYIFTNWTENGTVVSSNANYTFTVNSNRSLVANFAQQTYTISVSASPTNGGSVYVGNNPGQTQGTYTNGQSCTVHATANSGYTFTNWTENGNVVSNSANYTFTVTGNRALVAHFVQQYTINVSASPANGGTVSGGGQYQQGQQCTVSATANSGYTFTNWTENGNVVSTNSNYTFTVNSNRNLVAHFIQLYTINVSASPTNGGTVTGGGTYQQGQQCTVIATAAQGFTFTNWTENGSMVSTNPNYSFTVTSNRTLVANFTVQAPNTYSINVLPNPNNGGNVTGGGTYQQGQQCTVTATANDGYAFINWTENGNVVSTQASYTFTVSGNRTLVANFQVQSFDITVTIDPVEGGTVIGEGTYNYGESCTLLASPNNGYNFVGWKENGILISTNPVMIFVVTGDVSYVAHFDQSVNSYTITASSDPTEGGSVSGGGNYSQGEECTLTASPNIGYTFVNWTKNGSLVSVEASFSFTVTENATYIAHFTQSVNGYTISVSANLVDGGSVMGGGIYAPGLTCILTATTNEGYKFVNWTENGVIQWLTEQYSFVVDRDRTLIANFEALPTFTISAMSGPNGSITPQGDVVVVKGSDQTFTMTPNTGGRIVKVLVDGIDIGPIESYTFTNVNHDHTIYVSFSGMGVGETQALNVNVYPNPAKDKVYVEGEGIEAVILYDMLGNCLRNMDYNTGKVLNVSGLPQGTYVLKLMTQDGRIGYQKLVLN